MASVIGAVKNITTDSFWFGKFLVLSYLVFLMILNFDYLMVHTSAFIALGCLTLFLFVGFAMVIMYRNINNEIPIVPTIMDFPEIVIKALAGLLLMVPPVVLYVFAMYYLIAHQFFETPMQITTYVLVTVFFSPFIFMPVVFYAVRGRLLDGYRFDLMCQGAGDFMIKILAYAVQYFFIIYLPSFVMYLSIKSMMGEEDSFTILYVAFIVTFSFFNIFSYVSDLYGESIPVIKERKKYKNKEED